MPALLRQLRRYALLLLVMAASLALPRTSRADGAATAFKQGRALFDAKRYEEALPKFETALASSQSPNARLYVARCLRELGRLDEAFSAMQRTVRDARAKAGEDAYYAQTRDTAATELAQLDKRVAKIVITLGEGLSGAQVQIGSRALAPDQIGVPVAVLPGDAVIEAVATDGARVRRTTTVEAGATKAVTLLLPDAGAADASSEETAAGGDGPDTTADGGGGFGIVRGLGIGVAAIGVAGVVMFAVFNAQADDKLAQLETECGNTRCTDPAYADVIDEGKQAETIATVSLVAGVAAVLGGTAMIIFGGPGDEEAGDDTGSEVTVLPTGAVTPQGGMAGVLIRF